MEVVEVGERAEQRVDVLVVGDVVAVVVLRRAVDRREPDDVDAEGGEVVDVLDDPAQVADRRRRRSRRSFAGRSGRRRRLATAGPRAGPSRGGDTGEGSGGTAPCSRTTRRTGVRLHPPSARCGGTPPSAVSHGAVRTVAGSRQSTFPPPGCPLDAVVGRALDHPATGPPVGIVETPCPARTGSGLRSRDGRCDHAGPGARHSKDWTWVLEPRCGECGLDPGVARRGRPCPALVRDNAAGWGPHARPSRRAGPAPSGRLVAARVRLPRPRRVPAVRRPARPDARPRTTRCSPTGTRTRPPSPSATTRQDPTVVASELVAAGEQGRRRRSPPSTAGSGSGSGGAATARCSPCARSPGTSSTIRCTTCGTSGAGRSAGGARRDGSGAPPVRPTLSACQLIRRCRPHRRSSLPQLFGSMRRALRTVDPGNPVRACDLLG